jgi:dephospho-CoA kinase
MRIGLTGGIGAGKSEVARIFAECGAYIIDADLLAREAVEPGTSGFDEIAKRWPETITSDGHITRTNSFC